MAVQSTYNVIIPVDAGEEQTQYYALFNTLAGSIEVIDAWTAERLSKLPKPSSKCKVESVLAIRRLGRQGQRQQAKFASLPAEQTLSAHAFDYLERRGYIFSSEADEDHRSRVLYDVMLEMHRKIVRQPIVVVPSYNCDLKCPYCWQRLYHMDSPVMSGDCVDALFQVLPKVIEVEQPGRIDFTIFGGEPLQDIDALRERVLHLLSRATAAGYSTKIISNGVGLEPNVPHLRGKVDLIQITIDGPPNVHSRRRPLPSGDSFTPMARGITAALAAGIRINVRVNTDDSNLYTLPELINYADRQGWLHNPLLRFHLAPVKNHNPSKTSTPESELLDKVLELRRQDSRMEIFDLSGFSGLKYFEGSKESGLFSLHRFFNCEAQINFFLFDLHGDVYACWDAAGLKHLSVGRFLPELVLYSSKLSQWRSRTSLDVPGCQGCASSPHCGGGCQFLALEHNGSFLSSQCDSMMRGYERAIAENADWLLARARAGNHAVGLVTRDIILHAKGPEHVLAGC